LDDEGRRASRQIALIHERATIRDTSRRAAWKRDPSTANAVALLNGLVDLIPSERIHEVFARTETKSTDKAVDLARFWLQKTLWAKWNALRSGVRAHAELTGIRRR
jgi:hypothetical protein